MAARTSLVEQKRLQWAREREEMEHLAGNWGPLRCNPGPNTIRTYHNGKQNPKYGSEISLRSLASNNSGTCKTSIRSLDYSSGSLINLRDKTEFEEVTRQRSPSLPPIYTRDEFRYRSKELGEHSTETLRYQNRPQKCQHHSSGRHENQDVSCRHYGSSSHEELEGETSGYASDSADATISCHDQGVVRNRSEREMTERTWKNPYYTSDENSLPPSRRLRDDNRGSEFNRQRWGSVWGQDTGKDPPPPSWLERGLSRLDNSSQVLVINHDSASSPESSTTGSVGSDSNKTYLRGQNLPVDADIRQEREARRQKAIELQNAIKLQLEEREKQRKEEKEKRLKDEQAEEARIKRETDQEKERLAEEQRRIREREEAKLKKVEAMHEVIAAAERNAKESKRQRRKKDEIIENVSKSDINFESTNLEDENNRLNSQSSRTEIADNRNDNKHTDVIVNREEIPNEDSSRTALKADAKVNTFDDDFKGSKEESAIRLPISPEISIILSGRLEDPELLKSANLQLVNLVIASNPLKDNRVQNEFPVRLSALVRNVDSSSSTNSARSRVQSMFVENRLLTPSKYRNSSGRDWGTQTDSEFDLQDIQDKMIDPIAKLSSSKECKDVANSNRKEVDKNISSGQVDDLSMKTHRRSKSQPRVSLDSRPRWNANRPGTRYRTQSEKDPHYQRRLRLRRRQVETSDEGSSDFQRSPSPDRRKHSSLKSKSRSSSRRKTRMDNYDADLSMDSLNSLVPLHIDKNGRITVDNVVNNNNVVTARHALEYDAMMLRENRNDRLEDWCGQEILSHLTSLRNGLLMKKREWDLDQCPVSPIAELY